ncbi:MAG: hypothetical protein ACJ786_05335, partial [Catenulispora sp.]
MTASDEMAPPRPSPLRRSLGIVLAVVAVIMLVGSAAGLWNPWRFVRLEQFFGDPLFGLVAVNVLVLAAFWLLAPVRSEAAQVRRHTTRWALILALVPTLMCYGVFHRYFGSASREVAQSPSSERRAAFVTHGDFRELRIWAGGPLTLRDMGRAGVPCGQRIGVRFVSEDRVHVTTVYGDFDVHLDHRTGRPLDSGPATCSG